MPALGISGDSPQASLDLRVGLGHHLVFGLRAGRDGWTDGAVRATSQLGGWSFGGAEVSAAAALGVGLRAYLLPNRTGLFIGADVSRQRFRVRATSEIPPPPREDTDLDFGSSGLGLLFAFFFSFGGGGRDAPPSPERIDATTSWTSVTGGLSAGYAFQLRRGRRIELAARVIRGGIGRGQTYRVAAADGIREFRARDDFGPRASIGVELGYVLPLLR